MKLFQRILLYDGLLVVYFTWPAFFIFPIPRPCPWAKSAAITSNRIKVFISGEFRQRRLLQLFNCSDHWLWVLYRSPLHLSGKGYSNESQEIILSRVQFTGKGGNLEVSVYAICAHCPGWGCGQWAHMRKGGSWYALYWLNFSCVPASVTWCMWGGAV